jgi:hypothetical protein
VDRADPVLSAMTATLFEYGYRIACLILLIVVIKLAMESRRTAGGIAAWIRAT